MLSDEFLSVFSEIFGPSYFGKKRKLKISPLSERLLDLFYTELSKPASHHVFAERGNRWNLLYFFLGYAYSSLSDISKSECEWVEFNKKTNEIVIKEADEEILYTLMIILRRRLEKSLTLSGMGFRDWFKYENYSLFLKDLHCILNRNDLRANILKGRPKTTNFFLSQFEVLEFLSGSLKGKIEEMIKICSDRSGGSWSKKKAFTTIEGLKLQAAKLHGECLNLEGRRITFRKCLKYILYLGGMGTIQSRLSSPVNLSSKLEQLFFTDYITLRKAAMNLGWIDLVDETFAPNIRCKTFLIKFMCPKLKFDRNVVLINKTEQQFIDLPNEERMEFASKFGYNAIEYLRERAEIKIREENVKKYISHNKSISFSISTYGKKNGKGWVSKKWREINSNKGKKVAFFYDLISYRLKWSDPRRYMWMMYEAAA